MKRLILILLLVLPLTVGALPTVDQEATQLSWAAPVENTDATPLTDLAGFYVYWSTVSGDFNDINRQRISDPNAVNYLLSDLPVIGDGTLYFTITAVNSGDLESGFAQEVVVKKQGAAYSLPLGSVPAAPSSLRVE